MNIFAARRSFVVALLILLCPIFSFAASGRVECNSLPTKILAHPVPYCVLLPPGYDSDKSRRFPILYFFHGLGDDEQMFVHTGGLYIVEDLLDKTQIIKFMLYSPAHGATYYIHF